MNSLLKSLALGWLVLLPVALPPAATASPVAHASCSSRYTPATIGGAHRCLHAGEVCTRSYERQYLHYGYECSTRYSPTRLRRR